MYHSFYVILLLLLLRTWTNTEFLYCLHYRDDEHQLIAQYCLSLNGGDAVPVPRSPVQIMVAIDQEQREVLEAMIRYVHTERAKLSTTFWYNVFQNLLKHIQKCCHVNLLYSSCELVSEIMKFIFWGPLGWDFLKLSDRRCEGSSSSICSQCYLHHCALSIRFCCIF